ncbi:GNAT family N-acetyltransferase [Microbulbifer sp. THAF38]|uniref:GNAT family N-acetyltransferase n=1 Tax=Microbulbifer sp. THAF38 TaxID=2587856 RepID=UPI00210FCE90|nr:GNAT family N-acetyltransferase [Microbulbifer sp. THAF38]
MTTTYPTYQGQGLGRIVMEHIMSYLDREALPSAYITIMADVPELYKKFGFELSSPNTEGMHLIK